MTNCHFDVVVLERVGFCEGEISLPFRLSGEMTKRKVFAEGGTMLNSLHDSLLYRGAEEEAVSDVIQGGMTEFGDLAGSKTDPPYKAIESPATPHSAQARIQRLF